MALIENKELKFVVPIINVLLKNNYPIIGSFPRVSTKGLWRGGNKFNVSIYLETNTFFDFVTNTSGNPIDLHCLITGENKLDLNINDVNKLYLDENNFNYIYQDIDKVDFNDVKQEIDKIYNISSDISNDHYFYKKQIDKKYLKNIKQLTISNFMKKIIDRKKINLSKSDENLIALSESLIIPMYNISDFSLQSIQYIIKDKSDGGLNKLFHYGGKLKNSFFSPNCDISELTNYSTVFLCEGVATGCTIANIIENLGISLPVLSCFNAMNIKNVAKYLIEHTIVNVIICSDYDQINVLNNKIIISASNNSFKSFNNEQRVLVTCPNNGLLNSQYVLDNILDEIPIINKNIKKNKITDFNDLNSSIGISETSKVFINNLLYYTKSLNKEMFLKELIECFNNYHLELNQNIYTGNNLINNDNEYNNLEFLNGIILESQLFFYN